MTGRKGGESSGRGRMILGASFQSTLSYIMPVLYILLIMFICLITYDQTVISGKDGWHVQGAENERPNVKWMYLYHLIVSRETNPGIKQDV